MPPLSVGVVEPLDTQAGPAYAPINATRTEAGIFISSGDVTAEVLATLTFNT